MKHSHTFVISEEKLERIRQVPHFRESQYRNLDIRLTLEHFRGRYVGNLPIESADLDGKIVADIGCGYGWLAMAFAIWTDARVVAVEMDSPRVEAARQIAAILGLENRIEWRIGSVTNIPLERHEAELVYCIEVLEHIQRDPRALSELQRVSAKYLVITTPNLFCPVIGHDTRLPFCHWLPVRARDFYASLFFRRDRQHGNLFWSPISLNRGLDQFERISGFLHYKSLEDYYSLLPYYSPYGSGAMTTRLGIGTRAFLRLMSCFGSASYILMPNLAGTFRRVSTR